MSKQHEQPANSDLPACCSRLEDLFPPKFFKALGDPNRIALLSRLACCGGACTVSEVSCCCPVDLSVVSRHLAILRDAGLVSSQRSGKEVRYRVRFDDVARTLRSIADVIDARGRETERNESSSAKART